MWPPLYSFQSPTLHSRNHHTKSKFFSFSVFFFFSLQRHSNSRIHKYLSISGICIVSPGVGHVDFNFNSIKPASKIEPKSLRFLENDMQDSGTDVAYP